jgi:hypothetical protein
MRKRSGTREQVPGWIEERNRALDRGGRYRVMLDGGKFVTHLGHAQLELAGALVELSARRCGASLDRSRFHDASSRTPRHRRRVRSLPRPSRLKSGHSEAVTGLTRGAGEMPLPGRASGKWHRRSRQPDSQCPREASSSSSPVAAPS